MSMHFLAVALGGLLEKLYPTAVPPHDYDTALAEREAEEEVSEPPLFRDAWTDYVADVRAFTVSSLLDWAQRERRTDVTVQCGHCLEVVGGIPDFAGHMLTCDLTPKYFAGAAASLADDSGSSDNPVGSSASKQQSATSVDPHSLSPIHTSGDSSSHPPCEDHPAGAGAPPTAPAGLPTADWLSIAVTEVLAEHHYRLSSEACDCGHVDHLRPLDPYDWREHVSPLVAEHILYCIKAFRTK